MTGWLVGWLVGWLTGWLAELAGWLVGWLAGWVCRLACLGFACSQQARDVPLSLLLKGPDAARCLLLRNYARSTRLEKRNRDAPRLVQ